MQSNVEAEGKPLALLLGVEDESACVLCEGGVAHTICHHLQKNLRKNYWKISSTLHQPHSFRITVKIQKKCCRHDTTKKHRLLLLVASLTTATIRTIAHSFPPTCSQCTHHNNSSNQLRLRLFPTRDDQHPPFQLRSHFPLLLSPSPSPTFSYSPCIPSSRQSHWSSRLLHPSPQHFPYHSVQPTAQATSICHYPSPL